MFYFSRILLRLKNQSASKATGVKNRGQISDCLTPFKIMGEMGKISHQGPTTDLLLTRRGWIDRLED